MTINLRPPLTVTCVALGYYLLFHAENPLIFLGGVAWMINAVFFAAPWKAYRRMPND